MKTIQHRCFVIRIQRYCERIAGCFHHAVANTNAKCAYKKHRRGACCEIHDYSCYVSNKSKHKQSFHTKNIAQRTSKYHGQCKSVKCRTEDPAKLFMGEIELFAPNAFKTSPKGKGHCSENKRDPAGQEKFVAVYGLHIVGLK